MSNKIVQLNDLYLMLGDSCLILSHQLTSWIGKAPVLEEELAISNIAQDLLGQARSWYAELTKKDGSKTEDHIAYEREIDEFNNCLLAEIADKNFAQLEVRQYFFDVWHKLILNELTQFSAENIAVISKRNISDVLYHVEHSEHWINIFATGTQYSKELCQSAIDIYWPYIDYLLDDLSIFDGDKLLGTISIRALWNEIIDKKFRELDLCKPTIAPIFRFDKYNYHTENLSNILNEMRSVRGNYF